MQKTWRPVVLFVLGSLLLATAVLGQADAAWVGRMDAMAATLARVSPLLVERGPWTPAQEAEVRASMATLRGVAHSLSAGGAKGFPDQDPTLPLLARELAQALDDTQHSTGSQLKGDARLVVATCIGCHTRADLLGSKGPSVTLPPVQFKEPWLKADVLLATRRFSEARVAYNAVVADEVFAAENHYLWERAVKRALVLEVRTASDPKGAKALVDQVINMPGSESLARDAVVWQRDIATWLAEQQDADVVPGADADAAAVAASQNALFARADALMQQAMAVALAPADSSSDVVYLRATAMLHRLLARPVDADRKARALSHLAVAYEALREVDVWSLYLVYNEACIEAAPHTAIAAACFERLQRTLFVENTGSAGGPLPKREQDRLDRLKPLAKVTARAKKSSSKKATPAPTTP
jgi:hypothetical protein